MKKLFLLIVFAFLIMNSAYSQQGQFKVGANAGIPVGDVEDFSNFQLGFDVGYRYYLTQSFELGGLIGYSHFFEEEDFNVDPDENFQFLPVAASGRINLETFFIGTDLGYAFGLGDNHDGGFYYRPHIGYDLGILNVIASYSGIAADDVTASSINLGIELGF